MWWSVSIALGLCVGALLALALLASITMRERMDG
jgi:hypothetical protein